MGKLCLLFEAEGKRLRERDRIKRAKKKRKRKKALISWLGFLVSKLRGCDYLGIEQGQAAERGERASWGKKESEFVCVLVFVYVPVIRSTCSHSEGQPAVRMSIRVCICVFSQFECINSRVALFVHVHVRWVYGPCVKPSASVAESEKKWLFLATKTGLLCFSQTHSHFNRDGELRVGMKPSFVWAMYALCAGKLKNISMIKAG